MRNQKLAKQKRNKKITHLAFGKGKTYEEIGKMFGISSQRAYQIATKEMTKNTRVLRAWAVLENGEISSSPGSLKLYYIFPEKHLEEIKTIFKDWDKVNGKFKITPCNINY